MSDERSKKALGGQLSTRKRKISYLKTVIHGFVVPSWYLIELVNWFWSIVSSVEWKVTICERKGKNARQTMNCGQETTNKSRSRAKGRENQKFDGKNISNRQGNGRFRQRKLCWSTFWRRNCFHLKLPNNWQMSILSFDDWKAVRRKPSWKKTTRQRSVKKVLLSIQNRFLILRN